MSNSTYSLTQGLNKEVLGVNTTAPETAESMIKKGKMANVQGGKEKIFKALDGIVQLFLGKSYANLATNDMGFEVSDGGCTVAGPVDFTASPHQIRIGGFWVLNEELLTTVPSTLFNPVQVLIYKDPPAAKKAGKLAKILSGG
jgi:hypothetical protein